MTCPNCGTENALNQKICSNCGKKIPFSHYLLSRRAYMSQFDGNDEELSTLRRNGSLMLAIPGFVFAFACLIMLLSDILRVLHGAPAIHFRFPIFATLPFPTPSSFKNPSMIYFVQQSDLSLVLPFGSLPEIAAVFAWLFLSMFSGLWGLALWLGWDRPRKWVAVCAMIVSLSLLAFRLTFLNIQTSFLFTALTYILSAFNFTGSILIFRSERNVLPLKTPPWTPAKTLSILCYGLFIASLLSLILLFRYNIIF